VTDHFGSFHDSATDSLRKMDVLVLVVLPLAVAAAIAWFDVPVSKDFSNGALAAMSIFAGLLLNVLVLCVEALHRGEEEKPAIDEFEEARKESRSADRTKLLRETCANISFAILIAVCAIVLLLMRLIGREPFERLFAAIPIERAVRDGLYFGILGTLGVFLMTLLMVLKRMHALFAHNA
jgi:hypothetical protein